MRVHPLLVVSLLVFSLAAGCTQGPPAPGTPRGDASGDAPGASAGCMDAVRASLNATAEPRRGSGDVTLLTHDSFSVDRSLFADFTNQTGWTVRVVEMGDAGEALNKAILQKDAPLGDVLFGVDNALIHRAAEAGLFQPYASPNLTGVDDRFAAPFCQDGGMLATPIDYGYVQLNYDPAWFEQRGVPLPETLRDVANETYAPLTVVENPHTSSPGFAFLLATVDAFGAEGNDSYQAFWRDFARNGGRVAPGWEEAYGEDFTQGWSDEGARDRPIVVSYSTSPAFNPMMGYTEGATSANLDLPKGAWFQVEAAGILRNAKNAEGAKALVDFMLGPRFQESAVSNMVVYPVHEDAEPPAEYARYAPEPSEPASLPAARIDANRDAWLRGWSQATGQV